MDLRLTSGQHVLRRDVADGTSQADVVVMLDVALHQKPLYLPATMACPVFLKKMPPQDGDLLFRRVVLPLLLQAFAPLS